MTLVGIYGKILIVPRFPFVFPKLCFIINYKNIKDGDSFSIKLAESSGKQLGDLITGNALRGVKGYYDMTMFAIFTPLEFKNEGLHKLVIIFNKDDKNKQECEFTIIPTSPRAK
jgi:hypothetical protein